MYDKKHITTTKSLSHTSFTSKFFFFFDRGFSYEKLRITANNRDKLLRQAANFQFAPYHYYVQYYRMFLFYSRPTCRLVRPQRMLSTSHNHGDSATSHLLSRSKRFTPTKPSWACGRRWWRPCSTATSGRSGRWKSISRKRRSMT